MSAFSVLLCVHKETPFLQAAVDSILAQTYADFEFFIVANACPDELWARVQDFARRDARVRAHRTAIGQLSFNLNYAANLASGDYLIRMDADDWSRPERFAVLARAIEAHAPDVVGSCALWIDAEGRALRTLDVPLTHDDIVRRLPWGNPFIHPSVAIKRATLLAVRGYLGGFASEDYDLWIRLARCGARFMNLPDRLLEYRIHRDQSKGSRVAYAEVAGYWLRELLLTPKPRALLGFVVAACKSIWRGLVR